jgi:hypothetical protein
MNLRTLVKPAFSGNVAVLAVFYRQNLQRIDSDNLMKLVLDAGTQAGIWKDDSQVTVQGAILELDEKNPRTIFVACDCPSTLVRGEDAMTACDACGKKFFRGGKARAVARWCSRACASTLSEPVSCSHCGAEFRRTNAKTIYCSVACRGAAVSKRALAVRAARTTCRLGHDLAGENVHVLSNGARRCRACNASGARKYRSTR